jgi:AcrR family transcriptional regulator
MEASRRHYAPRLPPAERREQLLDAALALIVEGGYRGVSMEAVARRAGVTKPVVYELFANIGELLRDLLGREESRALGQLAGLLPTTALEQDPDALLVSSFEAFLRLVIDQADTWRLILLPANETPAVVREHVEQGRATVATQVEALVAWGIAQRGGPAGLDVELAAQGILALGEHTARLVLTDPQRFPPERISRFAAGLLDQLPRGT